MKEITIIFINLFLCIQLGAQERFWEFIPGWVCAYVEEYEQGYLSVGLGEHYGGQSNTHHFVFNELNSQGDLLNSVESILDTAHANSFFTRAQITAEFNDQRIVVGMLHKEGLTQIGLIAWYNEDFTELLNYRTYDLAWDTRFKTISVYNDSTLIIGGNRYNSSWSYPKAFLINMDMEGNIRWQQNYYCNDACVRYVYQVLTTSDGGFVLVCHEDSPTPPGSSQQYYRHALFIKTDSMGIEQWSITPGDYLHYSLTPGGAIETDDGNILISYSNPEEYYINYFGEYDNYQTNDTSTVFVEKYSLDSGALILKDSLYYDIPLNYEVPNRLYKYELTQMLRTQDGNALIIGTTKMAAVLIKVTQDGEFLWFREHSPYGDENTASEYVWPFGASPTSDGGFIVGGEYISFSGGNIYPQGYQSAFVLKVDEYGCLEPGCQLTDGVVELSDDTNLQLQTYPNPAHDMIKIQFPTKESGTLTVTDVLGKEIGVYNINDNQYLTIDINQSKNGLHLLRFVSKTGEVMTAKIIKE